MYLKITNNICFKEIFGQYHVKMPSNGKFKDVLVLARCMKFHVLSACVGHQCPHRDKYSEYTTVTGHWPPAPHPSYCPLELQTKVIRRFPKISQSRKRPLLSAFSWVNAPNTRAFTFKTLLLC